MGKNRGIAVMLGKHDIAVYIMKKDRFLSYRDTMLRSEAPVHKAGVHKSFTVQCQAIFMKSLRMFLLLQIKCFIKKFHRRCRNKYISEILLW